MLYSDGIRSLDQLATISKRKNDRKKSEKQKLLFDYNDLSSLLTEASHELVSISQIDEDVIVKHSSDSQKTTANTKIAL